MDMKRNKLIGLLSLCLLAATFASCEDWNETEAVKQKVERPEDQNPELWAEYTAALRDYKQSEHFIVYARLFNSPQPGTSEKDFMRCLPDSLDIVSLTNADNFSKYDAEDMPAMREKGTKVLYQVDYAGLAGNAEITEKNSDYMAFCQALNYINETLSKKMAGDGEGCTALFEVTVVGAATKDQAKVLAKSVITSSLTKAAIFGHDANWGRILCAMGYSGADFDPEKVDLFFESAAGRMQIIKDGVAVDYSEEEATKILSEPEVTAIADIKMGDARATAWGCDLTYDYVKINADYRS